MDFKLLKTQSLSNTIARPRIEPKIIGTIIGPPLINKLNIFRPPLKDFSHREFILTFWSIHCK